MPILATEPELYPDALWDGEGILADSRLQWWCLHTKPRQEKSLARALRKQGITHYLPQVLNESRTPRGRQIRSKIPLFPGYLFLLGDVQEPRKPLAETISANLLQVPDRGGLGARSPSRSIAF